MLYSHYKPEPVHGLDLRHLADTHIQRNVRLITFFVRLWT